MQKKEHIQAANNRSLNFIQMGGQSQRVICFVLPVQMQVLPKFFFPIFIMMSHTAYS